MKEFEALIGGLRDFFKKAGFKKTCLGLSGGIDSAVVACIAKEALGAENVLAVFMPSQYTSPQSEHDALLLAQNLNIRCRTIPITEIFEIFLKVLNPHFDGKEVDVTEENLQARIRGTILMSLANKHNLLLLNSGNKSEAFVGYATLYGDMCGAVAVLGDVLKRDVYQLANFINRDSEIIPQHTIDRAPSAELRHGQKDSDSLPDYEIIDNVISSLNLSREEIASRYNYPLKIVDEIFFLIEKNKFKRDQAPPIISLSL